jgi:hypothetical protein
MVSALPDKYIVSHVTSGQYLCGGRLEYLHRSPCES